MIIVIILGVQGTPVLSHLADGLEIGLVESLREGAGGRGLTGHLKAIFLVFQIDTDGTKIMIFGI